MKQTKSFQKYIEKCLSKEKIAEINKQTDREIKILKSIQGKLKFKIVNINNNTINRIFYEKDTTFMPSQLNDAFIVFNGIENHQTYFYPR